VSSRASAASRGIPIACALLFLAARIALFYTRQPFFDELFTVWITSKPFGGIVHALLSDSGPPLYYFVVHALTTHSVVTARIVSLACATISFALILGGAAALVRPRGETALPRRWRTTASALLAVFPPAVLFAVDARAYAMCAMFVTIGVLALDGDRYDVAAIAFVFAAYSHYYGFLFFPLLIKNWKWLAAAIVAFAPGLWLAQHQPSAATAWIGRIPSWPDGLFARPPLALLIIALSLIIVALVRWNRFATMVAVPIVFALVLTVAGRSVYLPLRFESVIAPPLVLAIAKSFESKKILAIALGVAFAFFTAIGIVDHRTRPIDDYRAAAMLTKQLKGPIVASGYLYLETVVNARSDVIAYPAKQAEHPGWRAMPDGSAPPPGAFYWIGERAAPEVSILRRTRKVQVIYMNTRAMIARVM
jgi:hypothetical protein